MRHLTLIASLLALAGCASSGGGADADWYEQHMGVHRTPPAAALSGELGTPTNPVRVLMPEGERAYLNRLRCPNGAQPSFERVGSSDESPYGRIMDIYSVTCAAPGKTVTVMMDMYHCSEETRAVPGFDIVAEVMPRDKSECR